MAYLRQDRQRRRDGGALARRRALTIMFCAFEGPPNILRLYGRGESLPRGGARYRQLLASAFGGK